MFRTVASEVAQAAPRADLDEITKLMTRFGWRREAPPTRGEETAPDSFRPGPRRDWGPWLLWP